MQRNLQRPELSTTKKLHQTTSTALAFAIATFFIRFRFQSFSVKNFGSSSILSVTSRSSLSSRQQSLAISAKLGSVNSAARMRYATRQARFKFLLTGMWTWDPSNHFTRLTNLPLTIGNFYYFWSDVFKGTITFKSDYDRLKHWCHQRRWPQHIMKILLWMRMLPRKYKVGQ